MDSDDSEVSDGDEAANQQLQQQYLQNGGMIEGGGAAAAPSRPGCRIMQARSSLCSLSRVHVTLHARAANGRGWIHFGGAEGPGALVLSLRTTAEPRFFPA